MPTRVVIGHKKRLFIYLLLNVPRVPVVNFTVLYSAQKNSKYRFEDFAHTCERNLAKLRKLNKIATKPQFSKITMSHIKDVLAKQPLPLQIVEENGQEKLVYDAKEPWVILNLLEDNYLWSLMTEQGYEVTNKRML